MAVRTASALLPRINVSFSGCGFLGIYHVGSYACWKHYQDKSVERIKNEIEKSKCTNPNSTSKTHSSHEHYNDPPSFVIGNALGASAGALVAGALIADYSPEELKNKFLDVAKDAKSRTFGAFHPKFDVNNMLRIELTKIFQDDINNNTLNGKLHISLTSATFRNVIQSKFSSRNELIDALICSCYLPVFSGYKVPTFKSKTYLDGGFTNNQPVLDEKTTVKISPFSGGSHICPDDNKAKEGKQWFVKLSGETVEISRANLKRFVEALIPPENLEALYMEGYKDTDEFIRSKNIRDFLYHPKAI